MVLNSGQYELESDFKYVWSENNKYGKEMIFAFYCMKREIMLPRLPVTLVLRIIRKYRGVGNSYMALPLWRSYDKEDPRREFFYYDYTGDAKRDDQSDYGFHYMVPEEG